MARRRRENSSGGSVPSRPRGQSWTWRLVAFLAAVLAIKLTIVFQLQHHPLLQPDAGLDTAAYLRLARQVVRGDLALGPGLYYLSPLYVYFLAGALALVDSLAFVRGLQAVLGTGAVGCVFWTARAWYGERAGWIAAGLAALTGVFTFYETLILQSALDPILTAGALLLLAKGVGPEGAVGRAAAGGGFVFGLQILNRPNVLVAVAGILLVLVILRNWRTAALIAAGVLGALSPVVARNAIVSGQFALSSSHGGLNFFIGNNAAATGQYTAVPGVRATIEGQSDDTRKVAEAAASRALTDAEVSAHFTDQAFSWIRSHPGAAAKLFATKLALVFNARHQWLDFSYPYYAYDAGTSLWLLFVGPWLLVPLGIAGLTVGLRGPPSPLRPASRLDRVVEAGAFDEAGDRRADAYVAWAAFVPFYAVGVAIFFVGERYRLPLFVPLCVSAAGALDFLAQIFHGAPVTHVLSQRTQRNDRPFALRALGAYVRLRGLTTQQSAGTSAPSSSAVVFSAAAIAAAAVTFWPFELIDGRFEERLRLSKVLMNRGDYGLAAIELERAHALDPSHTIAEFNLGMALVSSGRAAEGIAHARRAVDAGVAMPGARYALAGALMATGDRDGAVTVLREAVPAPDDSAESCYRVALMALDAGAPDVAERYVGRALSLKPGWNEAEALLAHIRSRPR